MEPRTNDVRHLPGSEVIGLTINQSGNNINGGDQMAATEYVGAQYHALRLDPVAVPEPASTTLLLGSRRRR